MTTPADPNRVYDDDRVYDVVVIGGGHAGLTAAIVAAEAGASVCVLEGAPKSHRGGNSRHTRNLRAMHETPTDVLTGAYSEDEYWDDLIRVTKGQTNEELARLTIRDSVENTAWLQRHGLRFQPPLGGTLHLGRTNAFFMGGGKALMNALYRNAARLGIAVHYDAMVSELGFEDGMFRRAYIGNPPDGRSIQAKALIVSSGGFEANLEWLTEAWGDTAKNFIIRGTPYNRGTLLKRLLDGGAQKIGDPKQCHAVAVDGRAPKFDGGIVTRVDCVCLGIVVNARGARFYNEGEDLWPKRYAIWGRLVAGQPDQIAHAIIDAKAEGLFMPPVFPPETASTIGELAGRIGIDPTVLEGTVRRFNAAVGHGAFDHTVLDGCRTNGLTLDKTNWARPIDRPPFKAYSLRPGITFTYLGVGVDAQARMIMSDNKPSANVFAAGEIMAGNVLGQGYLAGIGMTIGAVFGRIAGREAAKHAKN